MSPTISFSITVLFSSAVLAGSLLRAIKMNKDGNIKWRSRPSLFRHYAKIGVASALLGLLATFVVASPKIGFFFFFSILLILLFGRYRELLHRRKKSKVTNRELPLLLDFLVLQVEAGHSISQALQSASVLFPENSPIRDGLSNFHQQTSLGSSIGSSLENLAAYLGTPHSESAILAISQAIKHGTPLGTILRDLSGRMRVHLIMEGEKFANTLSIKLLIPLVLFIFPASFLVIFCPVIVSLGTIIK